MSSITAHRIIQPYVCSTPLDFDAEWEHLCTVVFPALSDYSTSRGGLFKPVDWHHKLGSEHYASARVLLLALDCIRHSSPFFIGLLGETYGYHAPPRLHRLSGDEQQPAPALESVAASAADATFWLQENMKLAAEGGYAWLDASQQHNSITELEVLQGAFLEVGCDDDKISIGETSEYKRFYFRQPEHADHLYLDLPDDTRNQRKALFAAESGYAEYKIKELKARIAKKGLPVKYFRSVKELGELVLNDWKQIIDKVCPPLTSRSLHSTGIDFVPDAIANDMHMQSHRRTFVKTSYIISLFDELHRFVKRPFDSGCTQSQEGGQAVHNVASDREGQPALESIVNHNFINRTTTTNQPRKSIFLITGPRGCGKTAALANWLSELNHFQDDIKVVCHFSASGAQNKDVTTFMKRCIVELREAFFPPDEQVSLREDETASFETICDAFAAALGLGDCLLVLDGVDELGSSHGKSTLEVRRLTWLPASIPGNCKIVLTMAASDLSYRYARQRKDCVEHAVMPAAQLHERLSILREQLAQRRRGSQEAALSESNAERLVSHRQGGNPLYLLVIASELSDIHVMRDVDAHVATYVDESNASSVEAKGLWGRVLWRWCRDYSWTKYSDSESSSHADTADGASVGNLEAGGWVTDALRLIGSARGGLYEEEILGALEAFGYKGTARVKPFSWNLFYNAARCLFSLRPDGTISIAHQHFLDVFEYMLSGSILPLSMDAIGLSAGLGQPPGPDGQHKGTVCHEALGAYMVALPWKTQSKRLTEMLWHLEKSGQWQAVFDYIASPQVFIKLYDTNSSHYARVLLRQYYIALLERHFDPLKKCRSALLLPGLATQASSALQAPAGHPDLLHDPSDSRTDSSLLISTRVTASTAAPEVSLPVSQLRQLRRQISFSAPPGRSREGQSTRPRRFGLSADLRSRAGAAMSSRDRVLFGMCLSRLLTDLGDRASAIEVLTGIHHIASQNSLLLAAEGELTASVEELIADVVVAASEVHSHGFIDTTNAAAQWYKKAYSSLLDAYHAEADKSTQGTNPDMPHSASGTEGWKRKGEILLKLGIEELKVGDLGSAEAHLVESRIYMKEALCRLSKMKATYHIGKLRVMQGRKVEARRLMEKALQYVQRWFGPLQSLVASLCHDLGCLTSSSLGVDSPVWDASDAMAYLQKALHIRRHITPNSLGTADTLFQLAQLAQKSATKTAKKEALGLLCECLDIRIKRLGADHQLTAVSRHAIHELEVALHLGLYQFGNSSSSADTRQDHNSSTAHTRQVLTKAVAQPRTTATDAWDGERQALSAQPGAHQPMLTRQTTAEQNAIIGRRSLIRRRPQTAPSIVRVSHAVPQLRNAKSAGTAQAETYAPQEAGAVLNDRNTAPASSTVGLETENTLLGRPVRSTKHPKSGNVTYRMPNDSLIKPELQGDDPQCKDPHAIDANSSEDDMLPSGRVAKHHRAVHSHRHHSCLLDEDTTRCFASSITNGHASTLERLLEVTESGGRPSGKALRARKAAGTTGHCAAWYHRYGHYSVNPSLLPLMNKAINAGSRSRTKSAPKRVARETGDPESHEQEDEDEDEHARDLVGNCLTIQKAV